LAAIAAALVEIAAAVAVGTIAATASHVGK
jgi:hypothetical protein